MNDAVCPVCNSTGYVKDGVSRNFKKWMIDENGGMCLKCKREGRTGVSSYSQTGTSTSYSYKRPSSAAATKNTRISQRNMSNNSKTTYTSKNKTTNNANKNTNNKKSGGAAYVVAAIIFIILGISMHPDGLGWFFLFCFYIITAIIIYFVKKGSS